VTKAYDVGFVATSKEPSRRHVTLYQIDLTSGLHSFFCDSDTDVNAYTALSGGQLQLFKAFGHDRQELKMNATLQIDTVDIAFPKAQVPWNSRLMDLGILAVAGIFDRATMTLFKWDAANPLNTANLHSQWRVQQAVVTRTDVQFRCESMLTIATRQVPRTCYNVECNNSLGDQWCGIVLATITDAVTCIAPTDASNLYFSSVRATGVFDKGRVTATSGLNNGLIRTVIASTLTGGTMLCVLLNPWPFAPAVGVDTFAVVQGCDQRMTTCINKFNNLRGQSGVGGFRGFPDVPKAVDTL